MTENRNELPPLISFRTDRRNLLNNMAVLTSGSMATQVMVALSAFLIARQLGSTLYGQYASSMLFATFCSLLFNLGLDLWLLREGGLKPEQIAQSAGSVWVIKFSLGLPWLAGMFFLAEIVQSRTLVVELVRVGAINIWLYSLFITALTGFKAVLQNRTNAILEAAAAAVRLSGTIAFIWAGVRQVMPYVYLQTGVYSIALLLTLFVVRRRLGFQIKQQTISQALRQCPPYAISEFLGWSFARVDALIVAFLLTAQDVSIYSLAESMIVLTFLVPNAVMSVIIPALSRLYTEEIAKARLLAKRSIGLLFLTGLILFLGMYAAAPLFAWLLGPSYQPMTNVIRWMSIIIWLHSITTGFGSILVARGQQRLRTWVQVIAIVFNVIMNLWIAPRAGIMGITGVYIATEFCLLAGYVWMTTRHRRSA